MRLCVVVVRYGSCECGITVNSHERYLLINPTYSNTQQPCNRYEISVGAVRYSVISVVVCTPLTCDMRSKLFYIRMGLDGESH